MVIQTGTEQRLSPQDLSTALRQRASNNEFLCRQFKWWAEENVAKEWASSATLGIPASQLQLCANIGLIESRVNQVETSCGIVKVIQYRYAKGKDL